MAKLITKTATPTGMTTIWDFGNACEYPRLRWQPYDPLAVTCVRFGGNNDNVTDNNSVHTYTDIQIAFNRPVDNSTLWTTPHQSEPID